MNRKDQREAICRDDEGRLKLSVTPGRACLSSEWPVRVYCLFGIQQDV